MSHNARAMALVMKGRRSGWQSARAISKSLPATQLAMERTNLSHERTLMSWIRTATSLITFGFTIYKFFQLELQAENRPRLHDVIGPRQFAILMISIGLFLAPRGRQSSIGCTETVCEDGTPGPLICRWWEWSLSLVFIPRACGSRRSPFRL